MAGSITVSSITLDSDNNFSIKSNTGATLFFANTSGVDIANSIGATAITNDKILSVANTKITGNIVSSQIAPSVTLTTPIISGNLNLDSAGTTGIRVPSANTISFHTAGTEDVRIDATGNVGIGTSSPNAKLETLNSTAGAEVSRFEGNYSASGSVNLSNWRRSGGAVGSVIRYNDTNTDMEFGTSTSHPQAFITGGTEKMRIDNDGHVMIGSTSVPAFGAGPKLFVKADGNGISVGYGTATSEYRIFYFNSGDAAMYVHNGSNYASLSAAGAWTNASDVRLKKNIVDIKYGLADVVRMQPRSYQMNDVAGDFIGFVAQELQTVVPEVVSGDPEKQLGVDYGSLVAVAFKAIQELKALNDTQAATITALTARIVALES